MAELERETDLDLDADDDDDDVTQEQASQPHAMLQVTPSARTPFDPALVEASSLSHQPETSNEVSETDQPGTSTEPSQTDQSVFFDVVYILESMINRVVDMEAEARDAARFVVDSILSVVTGEGGASDEVIEELTQNEDCTMDGVQSNQREDAVLDDQSMEEGAPAPAQMSTSDVTRTDDQLLSADAVGGDRSLTEAQFEPEVSEIASENPLAAVTQENEGEREQRQEDVDPKLDFEQPSDDWKQYGFEKTVEDHLEQNHEEFEKKTQDFERALEDQIQQDKDDAEDFERALEDQIHQERIDFDENAQAFERALGDQILQDKEDFEKNVEDFERAMEDYRLENNMTTEEFLEDYKRKLENLPMQNIDDWRRTCTASNKKKLRNQMSNANSLRIARRWTNFSWTRSTSTRHQRLARMQPTPTLVNLASDQKHAEKAEGVAEPCADKEQEALQEAGVPAIDEESKDVENQVLIGEKGKTKQSEEPRENGADDSAELPLESDPSPAQDKGMNDLVSITDCPDGASNEVGLELEGLNLPESAISCEAAEESENTTPTVDEAKEATCSENGLGSEDHNLQATSLKTGEVVDNCTDVANDVSTSPENNVVDDMFAENFADYFESDGTV